MVLSLSTQGYQSILLSVSMHQNEPVKQSDMHSFSYTPFLFFCRRLSLAQPPFPDLFLFISPPPSVIATLSFSSHLSSPPSACSFLPLFLSPFHCVRNVYMNPIQIISGREREQQRDFVNGNLIHGEQGVCNVVHVPGSCLIAFGFVQIWLPLTCRERKHYTDGDSWLISHVVL